MIDEALPTGPGQLEAGRITLVAVRGTNDCTPKVALTGLYQDADPAVDGYQLVLTTASPQYQSDFMLASRRGTYRGTLPNPILSAQWTSATAIQLRYCASPCYTFTYIPVATLSAGAITNVDPDFTIVDRCH